MATSPYLQLCSSFMDSYYNLLHEPAYARNVYRESSQVLRADRNISLTASTLPNIEELLQETRFTGVELDSVDYVGSWYSAGIVVVLGSMMVLAGRRKFKQTFLISYPPSSFDGSCFLIYDALELTGDPLTPSAQQAPFSQQATLAHSSLQQAPLARQATSALPSLQQGTSGLRSLQRATSGHPSLQRGPLAHPVYQDRFGAQQTALGQAQVSHHAPQEAFREYASLLRLEGEAPPKEQSALPSAGMQVQQSADKRFYVQGETETLTVFVSNLPSAMTDKDIAHMFQGFVRIKEDGTFPKNPRVLGACFSSALVLFEDIQSANNAIQASPLNVFGRKVTIQK